ncbi:MULTISPECIES: helix-turn-helix domain-containing protein [unclassified Gemella]|uniref:helix-turn-helix domain-containing protein n=1 Tax=unclassified Gemella TaxID=2624949 RepID=UPI0015D0A60A|nr:MULTISPECIES: helix-turn-helix transcriptional regulator [unclassified Gemella]MBF0709743.1 helix-turn-helix transcriptional regulator [Gemella sp. GL1.1]NYS27087.1 helix-turn-helix transcriptional regulator [Gemella sp. GL1]
MKIQVNKKNVGLRIKQIRLNKGYIFKDFGKLFGASDSSVIGWENGRSLPNKERIKAIAKFADITVNELLYGSVEYKCICKTWRPTSEYIDYIMKN